MTELTIKDLNCDNDCSHLEISDLSDSCPNEEICGVFGCTISPVIKSWVEVHGCIRHPLALQVLAGPVIAELEKCITTWNENLQPSDDYESGIISGLDVAINLLKGGA